MFETYLKIKLKHNIMSKKKSSNYFLKLKEMDSEFNDAFQKFNYLDIFDKFEYLNIPEYQGNPLNNQGEPTKRYKDYVKRYNGLPPLPRDYIYDVESNKKIVKSKRFLDGRIKNRKVLRPSMINKGYIIEYNRIINPEIYFKKVILPFLQKPRTEEISKIVETYRLGFLVGDDEVIKKFFIKLANATNKYIGIEAISDLEDDAGYYYPLNPTNLEKLIKAFSGEVINGETESDKEVYQILAGAEYMKIFKLDTEGKKKKDSGKFFPYTIKEGLPPIFLTLSRYGIFDKVDKANYNDHCIIQTLKEAGVKNTHIVCNFVKNAHLPKCKLNEVAYDLSIHIELKSENQKTVSHYPVLSKKDNEVKKQNIKEILQQPSIKIGLINDHYFLNEKTEFTSSSIEDFDYHYNKRGDDFHLYLKKKNRDQKTKNQFINSYNLIKLLIKYQDRFLDLIPFESQILESQYYNKIIDTIEVKELGKDEYRPHSSSVISIEEDDNYYIYKLFNENAELKIWFDVEATTDDRIHHPYLLCAITDEGEKIITYGRLCGKFFLQKICLIAKRRNTNKITLYAHNASYDIRTSLLNHLYGCRSIEKNGNNMMKFEGVFYNETTTKINKEGELFETDKGYNITIKDTYSLIPEPLKKFKDMFKLLVEKEVMPFSAYDDRILDNLDFKMKITEFINYLPIKKDREECLKNINRLGLNEDGYIYLMKYAEYYCMKDVEVLKAGHQKFRDMIFELDENCDVDNYISIASLSDDLLRIKGCYNGCYKIGGLARRFIQRCLVGGRTMMNNNERQNIRMSKTKKYIEALDANSLYPSAMYRLKQDGQGFLKGLPKVIPDVSNKKEFLQDKDGYFVKVKVLEIGKSRQFPLLSYHNDTGTRIFTNDADKVKNTYIDWIALADAVKFQNVKYEIIEGYYFDDGFNTKISDTIKLLYDERLKYKKLKNPIEKVYKLILNSSYGKTSLKEIATDIKYCAKTKWEDIRVKYHNWIVEAVWVENNSKVRYKMIKPINKHFNSVHIGITILSKSKTIMNEVMFLAEDNNMNIFYQDTDSMFMFDQDIPELEKLYQEKYNRELCGNYLGLFSGDLEFCKDGKKHDALATDLLAIGKKVYIAKLISKNDKKTISYKVRLKGVPTQSIYAKCLEENDYSNVWDIYKDLYKLNPVKFNLLQQSRDGVIVDKCSFAYNKSGSISSRREFNRIVSFKGKGITT